MNNGYSLAFVNASENDITYLDGGICYSAVLFLQHLTLQRSEATMDDLMCVLKIAQTTLDVVIHVVGRTRSTVKKLIWKMLVFTKQYEIRRLVDGKLVDGIHR